MGSQSRQRDSCCAVDLGCHEGVHAMQNRDRTATAVYIDDVIEALTADLATLVSTGRGTSVEAGQIAAQIWELDHSPLKRCTA